MKHIICTINSENGSTPSPLLRCASTHSAALLPESGSSDQWSSVALILWQVVDKLDKNTQVLLLDMYDTTDPYTDILQAFSTNHSVVLGNEVLYNSPWLKFYGV
jgi:hypothetical protein